MSPATPGESRSGRRLPRLHAVTNDDVLHRSGWVEQAVAALEAGGPGIALHVRGGGTGARALLGLADRLLPHARRTGAALFVNDRVDVALTLPLDGVHLGRGSLAPGAVREVVGPRPWIGVSCHGPGEAAAAAADGADYAFVGSIFATASHPGLDGMGAAGLAEAVEAARSLPVVGIGGIGPDAARTLVDAGAYGVAAIRGVWNGADPASAVRQYLEGLGS